MSMIRFLRGPVKAIAVLCCQRTPNQPPQLHEWDPSLGDAQFSFLSTPPQCTATEGREKSSELLEKTLSIYPAKNDYTD